MSPIHGHLSWDVICQCCQLAEITAGPFRMCFVSLGLFLSVGLVYLHVLFYMYGCLVYVCMVRVITYMIIDPWRADALLRHKSCNTEFDC